MSEKIEGILKATMNFIIDIRKHQTDTYIIEQSEKNILNGSVQSIKQAVKEEISKLIILPIRNLAASNYNAAICDAKKAIDEL